MFLNANLLSIQIGLCHLTTIFRSCHKCLIGFSNLNSLEHCCTGTKGSLLWTGIWLADTGTLCGFWLHVLPLMATSFFASLCQERNTTRCCLHHAWGFMLSSTKHIYILNDNFLHQLASNHCYWIDKTELNSKTRPVTFRNKSFRPVLWTGSIDSL